MNKLSQEGIETLSITNIHKTPIEVKHKDLQRFGHSYFSSECPICKKGVLLGYRNQETFQLLAEDRCILCAQQVIYTDIDELRENDPMK